MLLALCASLVLLLTSAERLQCAYVIWEKSGLSQWDGLYLRIDASLFSRYTCISQSSVWPYRCVSEIRFFTFQQAFLIARRRDSQIWPITLSLSIAVWTPLMSQRTTSFVRVFFCRVCWISVSWVRFPLRFRMLEVTTFVCCVVLCCAGVIESVTACLCETTTLTTLWSTSNAFSLHSWFIWFAFETSFGSLCNRCSCGLARHDLSSATFTDKAKSLKIESV